MARSAVPPVAVKSEAVTEEPSSVSLAVRGKVIGPEFAGLHQRVIAGENGRHCDFGAFRIVAVEAATASPFCVISIRRKKRRPVSRKISTSAIRSAGSTPLRFVGARLRVSDGTLSIAIEIFKVNGMLNIAPTG